jgi:diaminopimelate epimerase
MRFFKYHGAGNDFIIMDSRGREPYLSGDEIRALCDRNRGVGADGLIFSCDAATGADAEMRLFNADGSEAEMSGNGMRCLARYLYEREGIARKELLVDAGGGAKVIHIEAEDGRVASVEVDMGLPDFTKPLSVNAAGAPGAVSIPLEGGEEVDAVCLSMGNPHCVIFVADVETAEVERLGPIIENHHLFPARINVGFAQLLDQSHLRLRVWERGVGETAACGTGACASFAAAVNSGKVEPLMVVSQRGGDLTVRVEGDGHLYLRGPAVEVFAGELSPGWRG